MGKRNQMLLFLSSFPLVAALRTQGPWSSPSASPTISPLQSTSSLPPTNSRSGSHRDVVIGASVGGAVAFLCIAFFIFWMLRRLRGHLYKQIDTSEHPNLISDARTGPLGTGNGKSKAEVSVCIEKQD